jgi:hypothetical protein
MFPTSLPGGMPLGITSALPKVLLAARAARFGMLAASKGVLPSSSGTGKSAQPSGTQITYFILFSP